MVTMHSQDQQDITAEVEHLMRCGGGTTAFESSLERFEHHAEAPSVPDFTRHGAERMQQRRVAPEVVAEAVHTGARREGRDGAILCHASHEDVLVVVDPDSGRVITVIDG